MQLRPYQQKLEQDIYAFWASTPGPSNAGVLSATGSGKTVLFSKILRDCSGYSVACAHRQELVSQMAVTLGRNQVRHRIIAPDNVRRMIVSMQIAELGTSYYDPSARCAVAGVDTLIRMPSEPWHKQVQIQVQDEAHHVLRENKWGKAMSMFPNAYGLLPSATMIRADGAGLGRHADGLMDTLIPAPEMRDIIDMGYLTDYRLVLAESDVVMSDDDISATTGDYNAAKLREAHHKSKKIVGDVVKTYLTYGRNMLGITFAVDVQEATKIAAGFRDAGIPAEVVSAKTPDQLRAEIIRKFKRREILQLVNVDLFGEGFDLPAIEYVAFARHTQSFALYSQQFGRALRLMLESHLAARWDSFTPAERKAAIAASKKPRAIIADHVGNILRHQGPPDAQHQARKMGLDRREKRGASKANDAEPLAGCMNTVALVPRAGVSLAELSRRYAAASYVGYGPLPERITAVNEQIVAEGLAVSTGVPCAQPYERFRASCPYCGFVPVPAGRSTPQQVDGNMLLLDDDSAAALRAGIFANLESAIPEWPGMNPAIRGKHLRDRSEKQQAIFSLKNAAAWYAGLQNALGYSDAEAHKRFYLRYGVDIWTAQTFNKAEAEALHARLLVDLAAAGVDGTANAGVGLPTLTH